MSFVEHTFALTPLGTADRDAYDYNESFDFDQDPLGPLHLGRHPIPASSIRWIRDHPLVPDPT
jgi:hypothetical protein